MGQLALARAVPLWGSRQVAWSSPWEEHRRMVNKAIERVSRKKPLRFCANKTEKYGEVTGKDLQQRGELSSFYCGCQCGEEEERCPTHPA